MLICIKVASSFALAVISQWKCSYDVTSIFPVKSFSFRRGRRASYSCDIRLRDQRVQILPLRCEAARWRNSIRPQSPQDFIYKFILCNFL
uniref:Secreted protein n=1 Tax=Strigamia maritima TaxID=126957 RepID=T1JGJ7_STRMM